MTAMLPGGQPPPTPNHQPAIQDQVRDDLAARKELGIRRYGTPLQPFNGRDALRDLYEELLDGACYAKQAMIERDARPVAAQQTDNPRWTEAGIFDAAEHLRRVQRPGLAQEVEALRSELAKVATERDRLAERLETATARIGLHHGRVAKLERERDAARAKVNRLLATIAAGYTTSRLLELEEELAQARSDNDRLRAEASAAALEWAVEKLDPIHVGGSRIPPARLLDIAAEVRAGTRTIPAADSTEVDRPRVVCLCGSTRFTDAFREANIRETVAGRIVLSIGCDMRSEHELWADEAQREQLKAQLDELHKRKIDLADEVLVLNVGGYVGDSTRGEIAYAEERGKPIRYLEPVCAGTRTTSRGLTYPTPAGTTAGHQQDNSGETNA